MRRSNHENIDVLMLIGLVTGEEGEGEGKSHSKVGTRWVRQLFTMLSELRGRARIQQRLMIHCEGHGLTQQGGGDLSVEKMTHSLSLQCNTCIVYMQCYSIQE